MSIEIRIRDPRSCRLAKLMKAVSEYVAESGNETVGLNMDLTWYPKEEKKEDAD
ncbi:hypothetical protein ES702_01958 [subsurface metagenome]